MRTVRASTMVALVLLAVGGSAQAPDAPLPAGDAVRGKAIFEGTKGNCLSCHRVSGVGSLYGPDLSTIGLPQRGGGAGPRAGGGPPPAGPPPAGGPPAAAGAAPTAPRGAAGSPAAAGAPNTAPRGGAGGPAVTPPGPNPQQLAQSLLDPNAVVSVQNRYVRLTMKDGKTVWGKLLNLDTFAIQIFDSTEKLANISRQDVREMAMMSPMPSYRDKLSPQELGDVVSYLMSLKGQ